jgi:biotin transport system substrate-specific component
MIYTQIDSASQSPIKSWVADLGVGIIASVFLGITSWIALPLPFTPIPIAFQVNFLLFLSAILGARRATIMVGSFLFQGVVGFPVFAAGKSTILTILGPTGGYLIGYLFAAAIVGFLYSKAREKSAWTLFCCMAIGNYLVIYPMGALWLTCLIGFKKAIMLGIVPFIIGDAIKLTFFSRLNYLGRS